MGLELGLGLWSGPGFVRNINKHCQVKIKLTSLFINFSEYEVLGHQKSISVVA